MNFLLDTNVVSELRKVKAGKADRRVAAWEKTLAAAQMYVSAISVFELELGILLLERRDAAQGLMLRGWMESLVLPAFEGRILPIDVETVRLCAPLHIPDPRPERDAWIAATALQHGLTVVTRNVRDFEPMGVAVLSPWE